jgi:hypothetical protein
MNDEGFTWPKFFHMLWMIKNIARNCLIMVSLWVFGLPIRIWDGIFKNEIPRDKNGNDGKG